MLRMIAILFGIVFIFSGVAGFLPTFTTNDFLFGIFEVNSMHNIVHLVTGVLAIMAATSYRFTRIYFTAFGIIYLIVAIVGFLRRGDLFIMHLNMADNILYVVIAVLSLFLGLYKKTRKV